MRGTVSTLIDKLKAIRPQPDTAQAVVGFDGYVDFIQRVVKTATPGNKIFFDTLTSVSSHIATAAGKSAQLELRTLAIKMGGNAPIMSHALGCLGVGNYCLGMLGVPDVEPVFHAMHPSAQLRSLGQPASTHALEFNDGKLMLSEVSSFDDVDLDFIIRTHGEDFILDPVRHSKLVAMVDWSNLPKCTRLWSDLFDLLRHHALTDRIFFFDLCDPAKKNPDEIRAALDVICRYADLGQVVLGLNENEARKVGEALLERTLADRKSLPDELQEVASFIFEMLSIDLLLVHPVDRSIVVTDTLTVELMGRVVSNPKILTGGGDNLNAGFCFGLLHNFSTTECMLTGMAASGAYVQNGYSPSIQDLIEFLNPGMKVNLATIG
jgi:hypothetical protein